MKIINAIKKELKSRMTMQRVRFEFVDTVDGQSVFSYVDCYGQRWLSNPNRSWFTFRVKV